LVNDTHNTSNELNEWREAAKDAEDGRDRKFRMIKAFTKLPYLDDDIKLISIKPLHHPFVRLTFFSGVNKVGAPAASPVGFDDLMTVCEIER
jgi:hypothetical protein